VDSGSKSIDELFGAVSRRRAIAPRRDCRLRIMTELLRVGSYCVPVEAAMKFASDYLNPHGTKWSYPAYEEFPGSPGADLGVQDLTSIILLNVSQQPVRTYYALKALVPEVNKHLAGLPIGSTLIQASENRRAAIAALYGILDSRETKGVRLTTFSKVLHRKRPDLLPLFDANIRRVYVESADRPRAVNSRKKLGNDQFVKAWLFEVQQDLESQIGNWQEIAALGAGGPRVSPSRALDVIGWWMGDNLKGPWKKNPASLTLAGD